MGVIIIVVIRFLILLIPLQVTTNAVFIRGKLYFSAYLYSAVKLLSGYITFHLDGYAVHISKKKAFFVRYDKIKENNDNMKKAKGFKLRYIRLITEINKNSDKLVELSFISQAVTSALLPFINSVFDKSDIKSGVIYSKGESNLSVLSVIRFNILTVILFIFKIILGRILSYGRNVKANRRFN